MIKLITLKEALYRLNIGKTKLYNLINSGLIKPVKIGSRTYFTDYDLNNFIVALRGEFSWKI